MHVFSRFSWWGLSLAASVLVLAGCGQSPSAASSSQTSSSSSGATPSPSPSPSSQTSAALVKWATATVGGHSETVLVTAAGRTLYYFTHDTARQSACNSGCTAIWPPYLDPSGVTTGLPAGFSVVPDGHGQQLAYRGHLLYTYADDTAPGQVNGQGILNAWFAVTPQLKPLGWTGANSASSSAGAAGGY